MYPLVDRLFAFFMFFFLFLFCFISLALGIPRKKCKMLQATIHSIQNDIAWFSELYIAGTLSVILFLFCFCLKSLWFQCHYVIVKKKKLHQGYAYICALVTSACIIQSFSKVILLCNFRQELKLVYFFSFFCLFSCFQKTPFHQLLLKERFIMHHIV